MTLPELFRTFPDERVSELWLSAIRWRGKIWCPTCGSRRCPVSGARNPRHLSQRYRCKDCKSRFSVRKGTTLEKNKTSLREWVWAIHLVSTDMGLETSKLTLHDALGISRNTAVTMARTLEVLPRRREKMDHNRQRWPILDHLEIRKLKVTARPEEIAGELLRQLVPPDPSLRIVTNPRD